MESACKVCSNLIMAENELKRDVKGAMQLTLVHVLRYSTERNYTRTHYCSRKVIGFSPVIQAASKHGSTALCRGTHQHACWRTLEKIRLHDEDLCSNLIMTEKELKQLPLAHVF